MSALDCLKEFPEVFSLQYMCLLRNLDKRSAIDALYEWKKRGLIESAGPRSGMYYNILKSGKISGDMRVKALLKEYPSAILMGESVLHNSGCTTQIPQEISVAVLSRPTYVKIDGFSLNGRPKRWYKEYQSHFLNQEDVEFATFGLRTLPPHLALLDLYKDEKIGGWKPDIDDLEIDDIMDQLSELSAKNKMVFPASFHLIEQPNQSAVADKKMKMK